MRFKTEKEFVKEFGSEWRHKVPSSWYSPGMDKFFGQERHLINRGCWVISSDMLTNKPLSSVKKEKVVFKEGDKVRIVKEDSDRPRKMYRGQIGYIATYTNNDRLCYSNKMQFVKPYKDSDGEDYAWPEDCLELISEPVNNRPKVIHYSGPVVRDVKINVEIKIPQEDTDMMKVTHENLDLIMDSGISPISFLQAKKIRGQVAENMTEINVRLEKLFWKDGAEAITSEVVIAINKEIEKERKEEAKKNK